MLPDKLDREKLYMQLTNIMLAKIRAGEWRTGFQIPTEEELCKSFEVSKITVRRAITNLVVEGHLEKKQGKGTFVRQGPPRAGISMKTTLLEGVFQPGEASDVSLLDKKVMTSLDEDVIKRIGPVIDRDMFYVSRLKSTEGVPVLVNEVYVPMRVCETLTDWDPDGGPLFEYLRENSNMKITRVTQTVEVARPGEAITGLLNIRSSSPCMVVHRLFIAPGDMTVAYSKTTARADRFKLDSEYVQLS